MFSTLAAKTLSINITVPHSYHRNKSEKVCREQLVESRDSIFPLKIFTLPPL